MRHMAGVHIVEGLTYAVASDGRPLLADLYLPRQKLRQPVSVILWLHGGGWRVGDRKLGPDLSHFFAERGFAMASIDYRLSGEVKFPAQLEDVISAVHWLRDIGSDYGFDPERIGLWGSSAGGHLAALAGAKLPDWIRAVVDGYGPIDFLQMDAHRLTEEHAADDAESVRLHPGAQSASADSPESQLLGAPIGEVPEKVKEASPLTYLAPGMPPYLILHGLSDLAVPPHQSLLLYEALSAIGNEATLCLVPKLGHGFLNRNDLGLYEPIPMKVSYTRGGRPAWMAAEPNLSFDMIEAFFRCHLDES